MLLFLKNLAFTILVPGSVAIFVPLYVFPHAPAELSARGVGGAMLLLAGASIYGWCLWDFATAGGGTPAPVDPPRKLVVRGLYRYTRNPMYLGVLGVVAGWAALFGSPALAIYGLGMAACFHLFVVLYEEPHLRRTFGSEYEQYCSGVGRWLPRPGQPSAD